MVNSEAGRKTCLRHGTQAVLLLSCSGPPHIRCRKPWTRRAEAVSFSLQLYRREWVHTPALQRVATRDYRKTCFSSLRHIPPLGPTYCQKGQLRRFSAIELAITGVVGTPTIFLGKVRSIYVEYLFYVEFLH
jgi:hypothetical protein